ncbi:MAG: STAS domain-containing protein [Candidatus Brocadiia bacterium]
MSSLETRVEPLEGVEEGALVHLEGVLDQPTLQGFLSRLDEVRAQGTTRALLGMEGVSYANSTALGALVTQADAFRDAGGELALLSPQPKVDLVLDMLGLKSVFKVFESLREARGHLAGAAGPSAPEAAEPGKPSAFPVRAECIACKVLLELPQEGRYRCPRCSAVYTVDASGRVSGTRAGGGGRPIEMTLDCRPHAVEALGHFIAQLPTWEGYSEADQAHLEQAMGEVCEAIRRKAYGGDANGTIHVLVLERGGELALRVVDHGEPMGASDFGSAPELLSEFEHRPHPARGNLLKMALRAE